MAISSHTGKTIITGAFTGIGILILAFMGMVGYYMWQIKYGDFTALRQTVTRGEFTNAGTGSQARPTIEEDIATFIRPHNPTLGAETAPVTIVAFIDFECPFCQRAYPTFEQVIEEFGPAVRVVFKHFPIQQIHPRSNQAALAAACAQEQGKFWPYYQKLFEGKRLDNASLEQYARDAGLRASTFSRCVSSEKYQKNIDQDIQDVIALGVRGTPTYFVNQTKVEGVVNFSSWRQVIVDALSKSS